MNNNHFGPHLTIDLVNCPREILQDYQLHFRYLKMLPRLVSKFGVQNLNLNTTEFNREANDVVDND
jgi:hypothetical protein